MLKEDKKTILIFARYLFILLLSLGNLFVFYFIFTPLTIYPANFLLSMFYPSSVQGNTIFLPGANIVLVEACIAGSAYFLLVLLAFSLPMKAKKRVLTLAFSLLAFLVINILRIVTFSILLVNNFKYFDITHLVFWYFLSGVFVFLIWLAAIKLFSVKEIPFYTDISFLYKKIKWRR